MILKVNPTALIKGLIVLPASKSYSIRAFIIAACGGKSQIIRPSDCDDAKVAMNVAKALGAEINSRSKNIFSVTSNLKIRSKKINVKESGTSLRFILPLLALQNQSATVTGTGTLVGRPNTFLLETLRKNGVDIHGSGEKESVPIVLKGGKLRSGKMTIDGSLSSQFISALLIACPQLDDDTQLHLTGAQIVSSDYIAMTRQILTKAGIRIMQRDQRTLLIKGQQKFTGLKKFIVPSDYGLAAFLMVAALLTKSDVLLKGFLTDEFIQADGHIINLLKKMGARFSVTKTSIRIKGPCILKGGSFSLKNSPDLVPIMAIAALFAKGKTRLYDIGHARVKESDRISDLRQELLKVGAKIDEKDNEMTIYPQLNYKKNVLLNPHSDHRLAMSFAVLGLKIGAVIENIECTHKSYPSFVRDFRSLIKSR